MNEKNQQEISYRRKLFRLFDQGRRVKEILKLIPRSRTWLYKWKERFQTAGFAAVDSGNKTPLHPPHQHPPEVLSLVLGVRKRLKRSCVGLYGARAIQRELKQHHAVKRVPSLASINRWLTAAGLVEAEVAETNPAYYPGPNLSEAFVFHSCDWTVRYLTGGRKVFAFHTVDLQTHALWQSIGTDKTTASVTAHALEVWTELALPDFLQIDNDAAFTGLGKQGHRFGSFVRLALYCGIELIFIPPAEAKRNYLVEGINHLWNASFWDKNEFASVTEVRRKRAKFLQWYQAYEPPVLAGLSVAQASAGSPRRCLTKPQCRRLPESPPLTAGRIHFIRRVSDQGEIEILKERWSVSKRLAHQYVWATLETAQQRLRIYYRVSERGLPRLVKEYVYEITERVQPLAECYRRRARAVSVLKLMGKNEP